MAKVGDKTHTQHGVGTITEVDTVRGRTQYRVAGAGFNVWLDETKIHVANEGGMFAFRPMDEYAEEARNAPQYGLGLDPSIEHFAGLDATIEPGSTPVNENNSTALPYDWTPQYHHDVWADEQTIQPGEQEIDSDDRLKATDSVSGNRVDERPYPGPNPDLFAKSSARLGYYDEDYDDAPYTGEGGTSDDYYDQPAEDFHFFRTPPTVHRPGGDHRWDAGTAPDGFGKHHAWKEGDPVDWSGGYPMDPETGEDLSIDPRPRATNPDYLEGGGRVPDPTGKPIPDYDWAPGYTPDERDIHDRSHLKHPESGTLEPGESWGHVGSTYRPAGLSDRYAYFDLEAAGNPDSPVERFRRDPVGFIELCGHLWTDGDDSLEKLADYTQLIDVDPTLREAAWSDVRQKAQRLRREGRVHVNDMGEGRIYATVEGDHGTYETMIAKGGSMGGFGGGQSVTNWACSCDWGRWAFKRQMTYVGRLCSHGYATYLEMQSDYTKANPITKNQPYKKKWARTAGIVEDYKSWLEDNDQNPEAASVAAFLSTKGDENPDDAEALYDYISDNHAEVPERDHDIDYVTQPEDAYKTADLLRTTPRSLTPDLRAVPEGEGEQWVDVTKDDRETTGPDQIVKDAAAIARWLHGAGEGITDFATAGPGAGFGAPSTPQPSAPSTPTPSAPSGGSSGGGASGLWNATSVGGTDIDSQIAKGGSRRSATGEGITDFAGSGPSSGSGSSGGSLPDLGTDIDGKPIPSSGDANRDKATKFVMDNLGENGAASFHTVPHTGSRRFAESSDAALLDKLREMSTTPAADDLGHMDDHNEELRDVVDELQDRGYDASFMVAAVEDEDSASDGKGDFLGRSVADWATEPFAGSGPAPKNWFSDSAGYVDENERDRFVDVTDAPDGDIIKFNDDRSRPQQGPRTSSRRTAGQWQQAEPFENVVRGISNSAERHGLTDPDEALDFFTGPGSPLDGQYDPEEIELLRDHLHTHGLKPGPAPRNPALEDGEYPPGGFGGGDDDWPDESRFARRTAEAMPSDPQGPSSSTMTPGADSMGGALPDAPNEPFDVSQTLASLHVGSEPGAEDWENASGQPFIEEVKKDVSDATGDGEDSEDGEGGDGGSGLGSMLPGLVKGLGGGGGAAAGAAGAAGGGAAASELAGLAVLANGGGGGVRRAGRGASAQVRVDPGARQPNRPRQAMNPPDDFGYSGGEIHMAAPEDNGDDIVAAFQRSAGAEAVMGSGGGDSGDIADRALAFLRTAGRKYSPAEQRELEAEHHPLGARNLPTEEELSGTHYVLGM